MLWLTLLLACTGSPDDSADAPFVPSIRAGGCGLPAYDWLPTEDMGRIVDFEAAEEARLTAAELTLLLYGLGLEQFTPVPYGIRVWRIRYVTQDRGAPIETTGLVSLPDVEDDASFPTLLWVRPTVGFTDACAPSADPMPDILGHTVLAALGYAVVSPDLLGMNGWGEPAPFLHPYVVPEPTAVAALDAVRALWRFTGDEGPGDTHVVPQARTLVWGASEGGFGALWADRYAAGYAPEIDVTAVIAAVPPTDLPGLLTEAVARKGQPTDGVVGVLATSRLWYGSTVPLSDLLTDEAPAHLASTLEAALPTFCSGGHNPLGDLSTVEQVFAPDFLAAARDLDRDALGVWGCYLDTATLRTSDIPRGGNAPVLFQVSENDELVVGHLERADAPRLCEAGYDLEYLECAGADHVSGAAESLPYQMQWAADRMAGVPMADVCVINDPVDCSQWLDL